MTIYRSMFHLQNEVNKLSTYLLLVVWQNYPRDDAGMYYDEPESYEGHSPSVPLQCWGEALLNALTARGLKGNESPELYRDEKFLEGLVLGNFPLGCRAKIKVLIMSNRTLVTTWNAWGNQYYEDDEPPYDRYHTIIEWGELLRSELRRRGLTGDELLETLSTSGW